MNQRTITEHRNFYSGFSWPRPTLAACVGLALASWRGLAGKAEEMEENCFFAAPTIIASRLLYNQ